MKAFLKFVAVFLVYVTVGVAVTDYRSRKERWSSGGPEIIIAYLVYPLGYPAFEAMRFVEEIDRRRFQAEMRDSKVDAVCPPAYAKLLRESALAQRPQPEGADYADFIHILRKRGLEQDDPRSGFVLQRLSLTAAALGDPERARTDAEAFRAAAGADDAVPLWIAAALLRGAQAAAPGDAATLALALETYERACERMSPSERPYGAYALGTVRQAAGLPAAAMRSYREALESGRIALGAQALVRAAPLAADDAARMGLLEAFLRAVDYPNREDKLEEEPDLAVLGDIDIRLIRFGNRNDLLALVLGRHLFPFRLDPPGQGERFDRFLEEGLYGNEFTARLDWWWEELAVSLEPAFGTFQAKLAMVERILDEGMNLGRYSRTFDHRDVPRTSLRETYYRLYGETGDVRWLDGAAASQIRLRQDLEAYETYLQSEIAFMRGEYRRQIDLAVQAMLTGKDRYRMMPEAWGYLWRRMRTLRVRVGERDESYGDVMSRYLWQVQDFFDEEYGRGRGGPAPEVLLCRYRAGEIEPPFYDFRDEDVREEPAAW